MKRLTYVKQKSRWNYGKNPTQYSSRETFQSVCDRLGKIEDILGDEYDLDRLCELAQADRDGRVRIEEKTYQCPKCGAYRLTPRLDNQYYFCFKCKTQFTKEQAEAALRREQE